MWTSQRTSYGTIRKEYLQWNRSSVEVLAYCTALSRRQDNALIFSDDVMWQHWQLAVLVFVLFALLV